jgi:hypothetical protein
MTERHSERPDLLMPVSDDKAVHLIEIEAMRQIVDNLRRLNDRSEKQTEVLHGIDQRLVRIESNKLDTVVAELRADVTILKADKERRDGAFGLVNWAFKNWPGVIGFFVLIFAILKSSGRI